MASRFLRQSLLAASVISIGTNILGRVLGYVREAAVAGCFGTGADFDTFILAFTVPELVTFIVFAALPMALIPIVRMREASGVAGQSSLFWGGLVLFGSLFAVLSLCAYLFKDNLLLEVSPLN